MFIVLTEQLKQSGRTRNCLLLQQLTLSEVLFLSQHSTAFSAQAQAHSQCSSNQTPPHSDSSRCRPPMLSGRAASPGDQAPTPKACASLGRAGAQRAQDQGQWLPSLQCPSLGMAPPEEWRKGCHEEAATAARLRSLTSS